MDILAQRPSVVAFSCLSSQLFVALYMAKLVKNTRPETKIVFGGGAFSKHNVEYYAEHLPNVDHVVAGRDVQRICKFLQGVRRGQVLTRLLVADSVVSPANVPAPDFSDASRILAEETRPALSMPLSNNDTCAWGRCRFCAAERTMERNLGRWSADTAGAAVLHLASKFGVADFNFAEFEINSDPAELVDFCRRIGRRKATLQFWGEFTPANCSRELFAAMAACGRWCLQMGVESFADELLAAMQKRQTVVENIKAIRLALEEGIGLVMFNLIHGFPGTKPKHVKRTKRMIRRLEHLLADSRISVNVIPYTRCRQRNSG
jgi:tRNA A37 methylthiotransferase MiaB